MPWVNSDNPGAPSYARYECPECGWAITFRRDDVVEWSGGTYQVATHRIECLTANARCAPSTPAVTTPDVTPGLDVFGGIRELLTKDRARAARLWSTGPARDYRLED